MTEVAYNLAKTRIGSASTDLDGANIKMLLLAVAPAGCRDPDVATITALLAVSTAAESSGTGYARKTVTGTVTNDNTNDRANVSATNVTYTAAAFSGTNAVAAVIYDEGGGTDGTRIPLFYYDTNFPIVTNGGDVTIVMSDIARIS